MKKNSYRNTLGFTLVELVLVIVVLGIVASIGSSMIADIYKNYVLQRATQKAILKTELAAQQIANLLSYRIPGTTIAKNPDALNDFLLLTETNLSSPEDNTHTVLEWIGADNDSFSTATLPGWSGFCDIIASSQTAIFTPGSNLALTSSIMSNLSDGNVTLGGSKYPAIFFRDIRYKYLDTSGNPQELYQVKSCMGVTDNNTTCISSVSSNADQTLTFQLNAAVPNKVIAEHYKLAWTAYAIWQKKRADNIHFDLDLYYNYQPWQGEQLLATRPHARIATNITVFKFAESGGTLRFKLCSQEDIGEDFNVTICKEKAIIL